MGYIITKISTQTCPGFLEVYLYTSETNDLRIPRFSAVDASLESRRPLKVPITIVTAASGNHACSLEAFLYHIRTVFSELRTDPQADARVMDERIRNGKVYLETSRDLENIRKKVKVKKVHQTAKNNSGTIDEARKFMEQNRQDAGSIQNVSNINEITNEVDEYEVQPRIVMYNMGMGPSKRKKRRLKALIEAGYIDETVDLDFDKYPSFWQLGDETRGEYGWKAGIIEEVTQRILEQSSGTKKRQLSVDDKEVLGPELDEKTPLYSNASASQRYEPSIVLWLDSGDRVSVGFLRWLPTFLTHYGLWTPQSQDTMRTWTHPGMLQYYRDSIDNFSEEETNCNGAAIAFDIRNRTVREGIMKEWVQCALVKDCIAPEGSSRENHRQDQAALTYLVKTMGYIDHVCHGFGEDFGVQVNQDRYCKENIASNPDHVISN
ncbi:hypothetical protein BG011_006710 [Mortierella polycephala]|uniref:Uncharacterized protein n=1 Tax=Mortierella polycephala TaxID=41804 RepID=A0A9P6PU06_9FUNG|nr:hypothetical protein BG011_006710 [Mortierella polycephala]